MEISKDLKLITKEVTPISDTVNDIILKNAKSTDNVKSVIDLAATSKALQDEKIINKIVDEKQKELTSDAEKKKIEAETEKIRQEAEKVKQEMEKEIAALEKEKKILEGEIASFNAVESKAQAFFDANKSILRCIGVREKLTLKTMQYLMPIAGCVFTLFQMALLPLSLVGFAIEALMNIVDAVCGKIAKGGLKVILSILVTVIIIGLAMGCYYVATHYISNKII